MFSVSRDKRILREFPELELSSGTEIGGTTAIETNFHETVPTSLFKGALVPGQKIMGRAVLSRVNLWF